MAMATENIQQEPGLDLTSSRSGAFPLLALASRQGLLVYLMRKYKKIQPMASDPSWQDLEVIQY